MAMNITGAVVGLILLIIFGSRILNDFGFKFVPEISLPILGKFSREPALIILSPKVIRLSPSWGVAQEIKVTNNSPDPLYQIQLWAIPQESDADLSQLRIEPFNPSTLSQSVDSSKDTYVVGLDYLMLRVNDPKGRSNLIVFIRALDPRQTVSFKLTLPAEAIKKESTLTLKITDSSKEQARILYKEGSVAVPFRPIFPPNLND